MKFSLFAVAAMAVSGVLANTATVPGVAAPTGLTNGTTTNPAPAPTNFEGAAFSVPAQGFVAGSVAALVAMLL